MKVWLDDVRPMPDHFTHWAKTAQEAIKLIKTDTVEEISLDHDLGTDETGYTVAKFIEEHAVKGNLKKIRCKIHSQNAVGKENIKMALRNAYKAWMTPNPT